MFRNMDTIREQQKLAVFSMVAIAMLLLVYMVHKHTRQCNRSPRCRGIYVPEGTPCASCGFASRKSYEAFIVRIGKN